MSAKQAHLEMIQGVMNRLSQNSFLLKGWTVVLVAAMFALAAKDSRVEYVYLAYLPAIAFWCLDAYYLWQERLFRSLYNHVRVLDDSEIDFSMSVGQTDVETVTYVKAFFSKTVVGFHGAVVGAIVVVMLLLTCSR